MPFGFAEAIGLGSSLLGGLMSRNSQRKANAQSQAFAREQLEFQKNFVQTRVADAKAAGIHPLYALGASGPGSPSFSAGTADGLGAGIAAAGQAAGSALRRGGKINPLQQELLQSQIAGQKAKAASDLATAGYYDSMATRTKQETMSTNRDLITLQGLTPPTTPRSVGTRRTTRSSRVSAAPKKPEKLITDLLVDKPQMDSKTYVQLPWGLGTMRLDKLNPASTGARLEAEYGEPGETISYPGVLDNLGRNASRGTFQKYLRDRPLDWLGFNPKTGRKRHFARKPGETRAQWYKRRAREMRKSR